MIPFVENPDSVGDPNQTPRVRLWPPAGYMCVVRGNDCPGHPSKWMTCDPSETEPEESSDVSV